MITHESLPRDLARLLIWYPFRWITGRLPPAFALRIFRSAGTLHAGLSSTARHLTAELSSRYSYFETRYTPRQIAVRHLQTYYINQFLIFLFPRLHAQQTRRIHTFVNLPQLETVCRNQQGAVLVHGHLGAIHLPLFDLGQRGWPVKQIGFLRRPEGLSPIGDHVAFRMRAKLEQTIPAEILQADGFMRAPLTHLKSGGLLMITGDGAGRGEFVGPQLSTRLFDRPVQIPLGPARLAQQAQVPLLPMFTQETPQRTFCTEFGTPIAVPPGKEGAKEATSAFWHVFTERLRRTPDLWHFWQEYFSGKMSAAAAGSL